MMRRSQTLKNRAGRRVPGIALAVLALGAAALACSLPDIGGILPISDNDATVQALASSVIETATAARIASPVATATPTR